MSKLKIFSLICVTAWSVTMWVGYFDKKLTPVAVLKAVEGEPTKIFDKKHPQLTDNFWQWEAQGRLRLIDALLDDEILTLARQNWSHDKADLDKKARYIAEIQMKSYGMTDYLSPPNVEFIPLRGDANGLYVPNDVTLYLNSKMQWGDLPFERFLEVVLHETMHHIMTRGIVGFSETDSLRSDFEALASAAFFHDDQGMAQDGVEVFQANPQELVAYRTQRAARYAGIIDGGLSTWEMSARMQEIHAIRKSAGF